jgi:hypothetical protein
MTSHPARDMHGVVQKPERHQNSVPRDMTRPLYKSVSGCVSLIAPYGNFCIINLMARTVLRDDMDRIDAIMRRQSSFCLNRSDPQKTACPGKRHPDKTTIFRKLHLILHWVTTVLRLGLSLSADLFGRHFRAFGQGIQAA